jgi:hypothetical protein
VIDIDELREVLEEAWLLRAPKRVADAYRNRCETVGKSVVSPWQAPRMPERLRLSGAFVDVPKADHARAVEFWSAALGKEPEVSETFPDYAQYDDVTPGLYFMVQATGDDTRRMHIDLDSADRDADVERLKVLGATELSRSHHWVVMRDPAGVTFCVVQDLKVTNA